MIRIAAVIFVVSGLLTYAIYAASAEAATSCSDTKGSVLAKHSRLVCKAAAGYARREHPRRAYRVKVQCTSVEYARSSCEWSINIRRGGRWGYTCGGVSEVKGVRRVTINPRPGC